jgi:hypothetical protein
MMSISRRQGSGDGTSRGHGVSLFSWHVGACTFKAYLLLAETWPGDDNTRVLLIIAVPGGLVLRG